MGGWSPRWAAGPAEGGKVGLGEEPIAAVLDAPERSPQRVVADRGGGQAERCGGGGRCVKVHVLFLACALDFRKHAPLVSWMWPDQPGLEPQDEQRADCCQREHNHPL